MDFNELFNQLYPDFFGEGKLDYMDEESVYEEQVLFLQDNSFLTKDINAFSQVSFNLADNITFGFFDWEHKTEEERKEFLKLVASVDETWPQWFGGDRIYCGFVDGKVASFCNIEKMGTALLTVETACGPKERAFLVGGPGCVGTVPEFRKRGIGLKMVQNATKILQSEGYDISFIHYTGVGPWYAKLGYETVVKWNKKGIL